MVEQDPNQQRTGKPFIQRLGRNGYLHRVIPVLDGAGRVVDRIVRPLMVEFRAKDVAQVVVGSTLLALPTAFTEEAWNLGATLPVRNIIGVAVVSVTFIAFFVYFNFYKSYLGEFRLEFIKRVLGVYIISLSVVALLLTLLGQAPWMIDWALAVKRTVVVAFPACMAATVADALP